jgi:hypothetical protein
MILMLDTLPSAVGIALGLVPRRSGVQTQPFPAAHYVSSFSAIWPFEMKLSTYMHQIPQTHQDILHIYTCTSLVACDSYIIHAMHICLYLIHTNSLVSISHPYPLVFTSKNSYSELWYIHETYKIHTNTYRYIQYIQYELSLLYLTCIWPVFYVSCMYQGLICMYSYVFFAANFVSSINTYHKYAPYKTLIHSTCADTYTFTLWISWCISYFRVFYHVYICMYVYL